MEDFVKELIDSMKKEILDSIITGLSFSFDHLGIVLAVCSVLFGSVAYVYKRK